MVVAIRVSMTVPVTIKHENGGMTGAECEVLLPIELDRRHDSHSGFRTELENLGGDVKGEGTSG